MHPNQPRKDSASSTMGAPRQTGSAAKLHLFERAFEDRREVKILMVKVHRTANQNRPKKVRAGTSTTFQPVTVVRSADMIASGIIGLPSRKPWISSHPRSRNMAN